MIIELRVDVDPKMLRETLCLAQHFMKWTGFQRSANSDRLQLLIDEVDRHMPLGPDGKHRDLHTETCGCEDKVSR